MSQESSEESFRRDHTWLNRDGIPGVQDLAQSITDANQKGVLFFLAVELELLLQQYFKKNGLPPTPIDLEIMLADAAKAMVGE